MYGASADPFGERVTLVLDADGEREVEAARARGDEQVTFTKGAFAGITVRTNMETGMRLHGDGRTERYGEIGGLGTSPRPWNRPGWATAMVVQRLRSVAPVPPFTLSAAAIDAARDVLAFELVEGDDHAAGGDELVDDLARGVQEALNRFAVDVTWRDSAGWWTVERRLEHGWPPTIVPYRYPGKLAIIGQNVAGGGHPGSLAQGWQGGFLSDAEVDVLDELAMVDSAHGRVPWLSARLAAFLRAGFAEPGADLAATWLTEEVERDRARSEQVNTPNAPAFALPGWADRWRTYITPPAFAALALAVWRAELRPKVLRLANARERAERHRPALPAAAHQQILAFHNARGAREHTREGQRIATWTQADGAEVSVRLDPGLDAATIGDLLGGRIRFGVAHIRVLDLILRKLGDRLADGGMPVDGVPRLEIPKGKKLAEALKLGTSGQAGADADAALDFFARVELIDGRGNIARLWGPPEARSNAPGRAAAWLVTPGELIRPTMVQRQPTHMPDWRQLVPWPDELPDDGWLNPRQRVDLHLLVMATALRWRKAAGAGHGVPWAERPGFELTDRAIAELGHGLEWKLTARTLADAGWWTITGRLITPGERLPRLRDDLDRAAEGARKKASPKKRR